MSVILDMQDDEKRTLGNKFLDSRNKNLSGIPIDILRQCAGLKELWLCDNEILQGTFDGLDQLTKIQLNNKKLSKIPAGLFTKCKALQILILHTNEINEILQGTFDGLV